ncbi:hypothetical protein LQW54_001213 [Pestalotiopsis sp. IQ-011]
MPSNSRPGSMDCGDECFYSFPSSRNASHEVSSTTNDSSEEYERTPKSTCSLNTALNKEALLLHTETDGDHGEDTLTPRSSKVKWTLPFVQQKNSPRHHHFCSKPVLNHLCRNNRLPSRFYQPSDGSYIPEYASSLPDEPVTIEQLVSSPAAPVTTQHWSSTSIGSSLRPVKSRSTGQAYFDSQAASSRGVEDIVSNIRTYLSTLRHDTCNPSPREQPRTMSFMARNPISTPNEEPESFLVSTNDIAGILDIVIVGLRRLHGEHLPSGCLSVLLPWNQNNKPVPKADSIIPSASYPAEPATTISSVKPTVTKSNSLHAQNLASKSFKATIISKKSVAEVS